MQSASRLQPFMSAVGQAAPNQGAQRITVTSGDGDALQVGLLAPKAAPSRWDSLVGALTRQPAVSQQAAATPAADTNLHFRSALAMDHGHEVATMSFPALGERSLTVLDAGAAMASAHNLSDQRAVNIGLFNAAMAATEVQRAAPESAMQVGIDDVLGGAKPGAKTTQPAAVSAGPSSFRSAPSTPELRHLLALVTLGQDLFAPTLGGPKLADAVKQANGLFQQLREAPGMSETRARQILSLAAMNPDATQATALARKLLSGSATSDGTACIAGTSISKLVPEKFTLNASTKSEQWAASAGAAQPSPLTALHADLAKGVQEMRDRKDHVQTTQPDGTTYALSSKVVTDCHRASFSVAGRTLARDPESFAQDFRAGFPAGKKGDQLALLASCCVSQFALNRVMVHVMENSISPAVRGNESASMNAQDVRQRDDGRWVVRGSVSQTFTRVSDPKADEGFSRLREPATSLFTVEFVIDPGKAGEEPKLAEIHTDGIYTSGPRQVPKFEPAKAMAMAPQPDTKGTATGG
ncbi:MAG: hypothetical protein V4609_08045 [Pseudomonadota bacterium]